MYNPYYREFYQKALVPIGFKDRIAHLELNVSTHSTHWLIALEGQPSSPGSEYYHWKVSIYPSDEEGSFIYNHPAYCSPMLECFNSAVDLARSFETYSKNDEIYSEYIQKKIS
ncbi:MAG: hypothetical protein Q8906_01090 [Bacillota bacterium]|nr:hypothetical protein [Bacillota bacterium]MDP4169169.1 hypothetical protein [Bacillota bacterium]